MRLCWCRSCGVVTVEVVGAGAEHQIVHRDGARQVGLGAELGAAKRHVQVVAQQVGRGIAEVGDDPHLRVIGAKAQQHRSQHHLAPQIRRRDAQLPAQCRAAALQAVQQLLVQGDHLVGLAVSELSCVGQLHPAGGATQEHAAEALLQVAQIF